MAITAIAMRLVAGGPPGVLPVEAIGSDTIYNAYEGDPLSGTTGFTYDLNGNLLTVQDAKTQTTTYTYDEMDRLKTRKDALDRAESYLYDKAGNLSQVTDRKGQVSTFGYDALNRRTSATYVGSAVTFGYDAIGRLTSVNDSVGGTITWVYDTVASGHHPRVAETTSTGTVTVEYDEIGRRAKLSATGQADTTYGYDAASQFTTVTKGTQTVTLAYDDAGRRTSLTYTYDPAGNRTSLTRANAAASTLPTAVTAANISYDVANELLRWNNATNNLTYDLNGNLATETVGGVTTTYTWDSRNRLTGISKTGLTASFVYDGLGRRTSKTINGTTMGFWYDGNDVYAELNGATPAFTYIRGLNIDEPYIRKGTSDEFYETDALGSSVALTNGTGGSQTTYTYEPFGTTTQAGTASTNPFQFTGRENDGTGLYYYRARYLSPFTQRFLKEDPSPIEAENAYPYVDNSPLNFVDPTGRVVQYPTSTCILTYNKPIYQTSPRSGLTARVAPLTEEKVCALQECLGQTVIITGGAESGHKAQAHKQGRAVDLGFNSNPKIDPSKNPSLSSKFLCCAKKAGFGYGIKEPPPGNDPQYHLEALSNRKGQQSPSSTYPNVLPNTTCGGC